MKSLFILSVLGLCHSSTGLRLITISGNAPFRIEPVTAFNQSNMLYKSFTSSIRCGCHQMNNYGFGSDLHTWGMAMWNARHEGFQCLHVQGNWVWDESASLFKLPFVKNHTSCEKNISWEKQALESLGLPQIQLRSIATQYIFMHLSPKVYKLAENTHLLNDATREKLISVHIRWGDKANEMNLVPIGKYIEAVHKFGISSPWIFLSTEDPRAVEVFTKNAPPTWKVLLYEQAVSKIKEKHAPMEDAQRDHAMGLHSLVSIVLAMQANKIVFTSGSNWSRLMEELCIMRGDCTMVDLTPDRPYDWL